MTYQVYDGDNGVVRDATPEEIAEIEARATLRLDALKAAAITKTYADVDAVTAATVGNRTEEYRVAEEAARAYAAAGYAGDVAADVSAFAQFNPTGVAQSNQWAADQIIAKADAYRAAQTAMRTKRFERQTDIRAATTQEELAAVVAVWDQFIADMRSALEV